MISVPNSIWNLFTELERSLASRRASIAAVRRAKIAAKKPPIEAKTQFPTRKAEPHRPVVDHGLRASHF
jgi:hypothetical protein